MVITHQKVELKLNHTANLDFRWQMYFNRFKVEPTEGGKLVSFAYQKTANSLAAEIVSIFIPIEGLLKLREGSKDYLPGFAGTEDPGEEVELLPDVRRFSPMYGNHVRLSRSGKSAEVAIFTMLLSELVDRLRDTKQKSSDFPLIPVGLFHSNFPIHYRLMCKLLEGVEE